MQQASLRRTRHEQGQPACERGAPRARAGCRQDGTTSTARTLAFKSAAARVAPQLGCERVGGGTVHVNSRNPEGTQGGEAGVRCWREDRAQNSGKHLKPRISEWPGVTDGLVQE